MTKDDLVKAGLAKKIEAKAEATSASFWTAFFLAKNPDMTLAQVQSKLKAEKKITAPSQVANSHRHFKRCFDLLRQAGRVKA